MNRGSKIWTILAVSLMLFCWGCGGRNPHLTRGSSPSNPTPTPTVSPSPSGLTGISIAQQANDIVWDGTHSVIYASVPHGANDNPDSVIAIDPVLGEISDVRTIGGGSDPSALAIAADGTLLYAGLNGISMVQRFTLPGLEPEIAFDLGNTNVCTLYAVDLQVAPGAPSTVASNIGCSDVDPHSLQIAVFDDDTIRPQTALSNETPAGSIQWGANAQTLYAANNETAGHDFYVLDAANGGVTLAHSYAGVFENLDIRIHYDNGAIYSDDGKVINPSTGQQTASFGAQGLMVPDSGLGKAFFLGVATNAQNQEQTAIESFNLSTHAAISLVFLSDVTGTPTRLIRWGSNGLAFLTSDGQIYILKGTFVSGTSSAMNSPTPTQMVRAHSRTLR